MNTGEGLTGRFSSMPSIFVIPVARSIYLLIAIFSLVAVIGGILFVGYLQLSTASQPTLVPVPPPFQGSLSVPDPPIGDVDLAVVGARLKGPSNIRFSVTAGTISAPLKEGDSIGYFLADTPNEIAPFPDGMSILGGQDTDLFERSLNKEHKAVGLAATAALVNLISQELRDITEPKSRSFSLRVLVRDRFGITSAPADVTFALQFAPVPKTDQQLKPDPQRAPTELEEIAGDVAKAVQPTVDPEFFKAHKEAMKIPKRCGASDTDAAFLANYRRAFEDARSQLTAASVEAFYLGLCDAWKNLVQKRANARNQAEQVQLTAKAQADQARESALAYNRDLMRQHEDRVFQAKAETSLTFMVVGGALAVFLLVSLVLAFLAIEQHSRAVRLAMDAMVTISQQAKPAVAPEEKQS